MKPRVILPWIVKKPTLHPKIFINCRKVCSENVEPTGLYFSFTFFFFFFFYFFFLLLFLLLLFFYFLLFWFKLPLFQTCRGLCFKRQGQLGYSKWGILELGIETCFSFQTLHKVQEGKNTNSPNMFFLIYFVNYSLSHSSVYFSKEIVLPDTNKMYWKYLTDLLMGHVNTLLKRY